MVNHISEILVLTSFFIYSKTSSKSGRWLFHEWESWERYNKVWTKTI